MKTAREIIADIVYGQQLAAFEKADAILAALAAEGFSIVETGRDLQGKRRCTQCLGEGSITSDPYGNRLACSRCRGLGYLRFSLAPLIPDAALSRPTREGKIE